MKTVQMVRHLGAFRHSCDQRSIDPAGPYFENTDPMVRLDPTDAEFVDVIHSDGAPLGLLELGLGTKQAVGHLDFFPNLGRDQPGCTRNPFTQISQWGILEGIENGLCNVCGSVSCPFMGFHADKSKPKSGQRSKIYLTTDDHQPFCQYHLEVTLKLSSTSGQSEQGYVTIDIVGDQGSTSNVRLNSINHTAFKSQGIQVTRHSSHRAFKSQGIQVTEHSSRRAFKSQGIQVIGYSRHRAFKSQCIQVTGYSSHRAFKSQGIQVTGHSSHRVFKSQGIQVTGHSSHRAFKSQGIQITGYSSHRDSSHRVFKSQGIQVTGYSSHRAFKSQGIQVTGCSKVSIILMRSV
ncbi:hypothetical protein Btru_024869 [Bulinus truncatus]|nr:hypothetical protein Btru_024869 [Bulinus truncatus]